MYDAASQIKQALSTNAFFQVVTVAKFQAFRTQYHFKVCHLSFKSFGKY